MVVNGEEVTGKVRVGLTRVICINVLATCSLSGERMSSFCYTQGIFHIGVLFPGTKGGSYCFSSAFNSK